MRLLGAIIDVKRRTLAGNVYADLDDAEIVHLVVCIELEEAAVVRRGSGSNERKML